MADRVGRIRAHLAAAPAGGQTLAQGGSLLGLGCASLGSVYGDVSQGEAASMVLEAIQDHGIVFLDTAPYYGDSEVVLGRCLRGLPAHVLRESFLLSTKVGRESDGRFDFSATAVRSSVARSLRRLGVEALDVVQCHDVEFGDVHQIVSAAVPALTALRAEGVVRAVGISSYSPERVVRILEAVPAGSVDVVQMYGRLNLLNNTLLDLVPYLRRKGITTIINGSPLCMGLLRGAAGPLPPWHSASPPMIEAAQRLHEACIARGRSLPDVATRYALEMGLACARMGATHEQPLPPCRVVTLCGASNRPELRSCVRSRDAVDSGGPGSVNPDELQIYLGSISDDTEPTAAELQSTLISPDMHRARNHAIALNVDKPIQ